MRVLLTAISVFFICCNSSAQTKISGKVVDEQGQLIPKATISLVKAQDSSLVKLALTDSSGYFEFINIRQANYVLLVSSASFQKSKPLPFSLTTEGLQLPTIVLKHAVNIMNNVTIQVTRPFIEALSDKTVINVEVLPSNTGATALEVLAKSPGVTIDDDGNVSLRGKSGVLIMIDGKPTYLTASDLAIMLRGMSSSVIDQIELITNPSAQYDAAGNSGIINIKTKKTDVVGFNGSISIGAAGGILRASSGNYLTPRFQNGITFNYRKNKINYFGSYNPNYIEGGADLNIHRIFYNSSNQISGFSDQNTLFRFHNFNHALRLGFDYYVNKKNILGIALRGSILQGHPNPVTNTVLSQANGTPYSTLRTEVANPVTFKNFTANFNWKHAIDTLRSISTDIDFVRYDNYSENFLTTNVYDNGGQFNSEAQVRSFAPIVADIFSLKSDYSQKIKKGMLDAGIKISKSRNDNMINYEDLVAAHWESDSRSNHFIYTEYIEAAYISINQSWKKWSYKAGLRMENTFATGNQVTTNTSFNRSYLDLFPNLLLSFNFNTNNSVSLLYGRRIDRPGYRDLNPFIFMNDSLSFHQGNANLQPQYSNNVEATYSYSNKIIVTANYTKTDGVISQIFRLEPVGATQRTIMTKENIATLTNVGLALTKPFKIAKWWNGTLFSNVYRNHFEGFYSTTDAIDLAYTSINVSINNTFRIGKGYSADLSVVYQSKGITQLSYNEPTYQLSIGAQKQILKNKGSLRLSVRDPFVWQKSTSLAQYGNVYNYSTSVPDARQISMNFSYRFGKNEKQVQIRNRTGASQEEQNRL